MTIIARSTLAGTLLLVAFAPATLLAQPAPPAPPPPPPPAVQAVMLLTPGPVDKMQLEGPVAIKGTVAELFGNKFILQDDTGRALIDLGPSAEDRTVVTKGEAVTVQGMANRGSVRAELLVHADGRNEGFGPPRPPRPDRGPAPPPPPPPRPR
jgi:hypothetical protein